LTASSEVGGAPFVVAVVGPTASGKSEVAELLAERLPGEVVSADSMQVYRGMDIGTAKRPVAERRVPYHCLDLVEPGRPYSAALFQRDARGVIDAILDSGTWPVVVGGTGLYVRAALDEMGFPSGDTTSPARARYEALADELGPEVLHELLVQRDPASAVLIHANNVRRVVRALEMSDEGASYAEQAAGFSRRSSVYPTLWIGLEVDRPVLYERIDARVDGMMESGLLAEVEALLAAGYRDAVTAAQAIGYKELVDVLERGSDVGAAVGSIKQATRRYAKRQMTWFRADPRIHWLNVTTMTPASAADEAMRLVESFARDSGPPGV
jgi:tRNA dimethylallyltransferase